MRCYSLSDRPRQDYYRATIKRIAPPAGPAERLPPAAAAATFTTRVTWATCSTCRAPAGTFLIDPLGDEPIVLIGAGIGVTPLVSMLEAIVHTGRQRDVHALFGFRNGREHPFKERLARLARRTSAHPAARELFVAARGGRAVPRLQPPRPHDDRARAGDAAVEQFSVLRVRAGRR